MKSELITERWGYSAENS